MIYFQYKSNPYPFVSEQWYLFNDFCFILDRHVNEGGLDTPEYLKLLEEKVLYFRDLQTIEEQTDYTIFLLQLISEEDDKFIPRSTINILIDSLLETPSVDVPKILYMLSNPDKSGVPSDFNALLYPDYFEISNITEESKESLEVYQQILKKTLDSRNNNIDTRNTSIPITTEELTKLATGYIKPYEETPKGTEPSLTGKKDINFSPNSLINSGTDKTQIAEERVDVIISQKESKNKLINDSADDIFKQLYLKNSKTGLQSNRINLTAQEKINRLLNKSQ